MESPEAAQTMIAALGEAGTPAAQDVLATVLRDQA